MSRLLREQLRDARARGERIEPLLLRAASDIVFGGLWTGTFLDWKERVTTLTGLSAYQPGRLRSRHRIPIEPSERNGLQQLCRLMVDKVTTVPKTKVGSRVGSLDDEDLVRLNRAIMVFLGLAGSANR